jgi:hypothetical protein
MFKYFLLRQNLLMMFCLGGGTGKEDLLQIFEISDFKIMSNCTNEKNSIQTNNFYMVHKNLEHLPTTFP